MKAPIPASNPSNALRNEYRALHESAKCHINETLHARAPVLFEEWFKASRVKGYAHASAVLQRPWATGKAMDECLLHADEFLNYVLRRYINVSEYSAWLDWVLEPLAEKQACVLYPDMLSGVLDDANLTCNHAPFLGHPLRGFFRAYCLSDYRHLFEIVRGLRAERAECAEASELSTNLDPDLTDFADESACAIEAELQCYETALRGIEEQLNEARRLRPWDIKEMSSLLAQIENGGKLLSGRLAGLATELGESAPMLESITEYREKLSELEIRLTERSSGARLKDRLGRLVAALQSLEDVGSRSAKRRQAIAEAKQQAEGELIVAQSSAVPPELPGEEDGVAWLQATFALPPDEFLARCSALVALSLVHLAAFFEEAERWEVFAVKAAPAMPPMVPPSPLPVPTETPVVTALKAPPSPEFSLPPPPKPKAVETAEAIAPALETIPPPAPVIAKSTVAVIVAPSAAPSLEAKGQDMASAPVAAGTVTAKPANGQGLVAGANRVGFPEVLHGFAQSEAGRCLIRDAALAWSDQPELANLPRPLWELLHIQPALLSPTSQEASHAVQWLMELGEWVPRNRFEAMLGWSAAIVPAFVGAANEAYPVLQNTREHIPSGPLQELTHETLGLFERVPGCSAESIRTGSRYDQWERQAQEQRKALLADCDSARHKKTSYQKATKIWQRLNGPDGCLRKLAQTVNAAGAPSEMERQNRPLLQLVERERIIETLTREVVSNNTVEIEGKARQQLHTWIEDFAHKVQQHLRHLSSEPDDQNYITNQLQAFLSKSIPHLEMICQLGISMSPSGLEQYTVNTAAKALSELLRAAPLLSVANQPISEATWIARLCLPSLELETLSGELIRIAPDELRAKLRPEDLRSVSDATETRIKAGDLGNAQRLLSHIESTENHDRLVQFLNDEIPHWTMTLDHGLRNLKSRVGVGRALLVVNEMEAQSYLSRLAALECECKESQNFGSVIRRMREIGAELDGRMAMEAQILRDKLVRNPKVEPAIRQRIERLLERNDLATVREYFSRIEDGKPLPQVYVDETEKRFGQEQEEAIRKGFGAGGGFDGLLVALRNKQAFAGFDFAGFGNEYHGDALRWLDKGWQGMKRNRQDTEAVKVWFQGLGFIVNSVVSRGGCFDVATERITERDLCPIPSYGSLANGGYSVSVFPGPTDPAQMLPTRDTASIVVALYPLATGVRQAFARHCREKRKRALLVDDCLMAFLARQAQGRMRSFFRATFPFTWVDPYLPTTSLVPPELFFGRTKALDALIDFDKQRCFVYGGRQLGKTALLREVERRVHRPDQETYAVWTDLQALEFGRQTEPKEIWGKLEPELRTKLPGFDAVLEKYPRGAQPVARLTAALLNWVQAVPQRKLLLLLDEGDLFLDSDGANDFAETRKLKGLMDDSKRSIKVVFAGLHNVQRSTTQPNHPLAHLGEAIQIGAFSAHEEWMEAYSLVVGPLSALGYTFESVDLPSRVLTACNFYPGLIQQFGHRLLDRLRTRSRSDWPCAVSADDVDAVANDEELRRFMIDRFQLTLQLDLRYHYLAYLFALRFHEDKQVAADGLRLDELKTLAASERPGVFGNLTREAFATLVEEMVGLGVFQAEQTRERVFLRNTNILLFLGSKSQIEDMLLEDRQEMRYDYKAHTCRGVAGRQGRDSRRRWLTRVEENKLFEPTGQLAYLSALPMAQSSTLSESLRAAVQSLAGGTMHDLRLAQPMDIETKLKSLSGRDASEGLNLVLIRINTWSKWDEFHRVANDFVKRPRTVKFYSLIVEVPPAFALSSEGAVFLANKNVTQFCARRWEREFVGPWLQESECTATHQQLDQVMDLTDGWPEFLHEFVRQHQETQRWDRAIEQTKQAMDLRFAQPSELMGKSFGLPSTKNRLIEAISELSRKGSASFSSGDFDVAAEITGLPPATIAYGVAQAAHYGLVVSNDSRHRCTPLFTRMLTAL